MRLWICFIVILLTFEVQATQPEYLIADNSEPLSVTDLDSTVTDMFYPRKGLASRFAVLQAKKERLAPFWHDSLVSFKIRQYYFEQDDTNPPDAQADALGGNLHFESGQLCHLLKMGGTFYTSQKIYGPLDKPNSLLLKPIQSSFSVLGEAYLSLNLTERTELKAFRQAINLPYINKNDTRMVPNTFEAYGIISRQDIASVDFVLGQVQKMKQRQLDSFMYLSQVAGFPNTEYGLSLAGIQWHASEHNRAAVIYQYAWNYFATTYSEARFLFNEQGKVPTNFRVQWTNQTSVGNEIGGNFHTNNAAVEVALNALPLVLSFSGSVTHPSHNILKPFGGSPSYLSLMISDFDKAGEKAGLVGITYDFSRWNMSGLSTTFSYAQGESSDLRENEWDLTVDYRPKHCLTGLWLRGRYAKNCVHESIPSTTQQWRFIINYDTDLF